MRKLFGTDGIRGRAGVDLTTDLAADVGRALASVLRRDVERPRIVIGRDTRISGPEFEDAFVDGFSSAGGDALAADVLPTAGVAYLTSDLGTDAGVVISASHNPPHDNGIKIFGRGGWKLSLDVEREIEVLVHDGAKAPVLRGTIEHLDDATERYVSHLVASVRSDLSGLELVVDCANGAGCAVAPTVLERLGVTLDAIHCEGDGEHINDGGGALHPEVVMDESKRRASVGMTLDGDADRVLMSDEEGRLVDGDAIIALLAPFFGARAVVVTVMANQALREWASSVGIEVVETPVGDRHVLEAMRARSLVVGGEQSGHIICLEHATTGDGILTGLKVLDLVASSGKRLADLVPFQPFPQVMVNVRGRIGNGALDAAGVRDAIDVAQRKLGEHGRVLVRPSGTEPLVRVMVEAPDEALATEMADLVATAVSEELA